MPTRMIVNTPNLTFLYQSEILLLSHWLNSWLSEEAAAESFDKLVSPKYNGVCEKGAVEKDYWQIINLMALCKVTTP